MSEFSDKKVLHSWHKNSAAWTRAIRAQEIESRRLVTDQAIVDAVMAEAARNVVDIGCGEGWLVRSLAAKGLVATGVDAVPDLLEKARESGPGEYLCLTYEELAATGLKRQFDVAVCNFSLIGKDAVDRLIASIPALLTANGRLIIQTLNPNSERGSDNYRDGWRPGSWNGFSEDFVDPAPWYFRTTESWLALLKQAGFSDIEIREPLHPKTAKPASIIFSARR